MANRLAAGIVRAGRAAVFVVGLAVVLALVFGAATTAMGATGGNFILGKANAATTVSKLAASVAGPALTLVNNSTAAAATALNISVAEGKAPLKVNAGAGTATDLSADELDGKDSSEFAAVGAFGAAEVIDANYPAAMFGGTYTSKGGTLIVSASGSAFRSSAHAEGPGKIGVEVEVDGQVRGRMVGYANELDSHKALVNDFIVLEDLPPGPHEITLWNMYDSGNCWDSSRETTDTFCTSLDKNDHFRVSTMELPATD